MTETKQGGPEKKSGPSPERIAPPSGVFVPVEKPQSIGSGGKLGFKVTDFSGIRP